MPALIVMILEPHGVQTLKRRICSEDWEGNEKTQRHGRAKPAQGQSWESWEGNFRVPAHGVNEEMVLLESTSYTATCWNSTREQLNTFCCEKELYLAQLL